MTAWKEVNLIENAPAHIVGTVLYNPVGGRQNAAQR